MTLYFWDSEKLIRIETRPLNRQEEEVVRGKQLNPYREILKLGQRDMVYVPRNQSKAFKSWAKQQLPPPVEEAKPWSVPLRELLTGIVRGRALEAKGDVAIICDLGSARVLAGGLHKGPASATWQTAIVNALQNCAEDVRGQWCIASYEPTHMCRGMAQVLGVKLLWVKTEQVRERPRDPPRTVHTVLSDHAMEATAKIADIVPSARVNAVENPAEFFRALHDLGEVGQLSKSRVGQIVGGVTQVDLFTARARLDEPVHRAFATIPEAVVQDINYGHDLYLALALALAGVCWSPKTRGKCQSEIACGNNVAAVLVCNNRIIGWGLNVMNQHPTFHAETVAIQVYLSQTGKTQLPRGCDMYSSLQPCHMCAGFIAHVGRNVTVRYATQDRGLSTVLDGEDSPNGCRARRYERRFFGNLVRQLNDLVETRIDEDTRGTTSVLFDRGVDRHHERAVSFGRSGRRRLNEIRSIRRDGHWLEQTDFDELRQLKEVEEYLDDWLEELGELGREFVSFANHLIDIAMNTKNTYSKFTVDLAHQCLDLLAIAAAMGMTTRYGLAVVNELFKRAGMLDRWVSHEG